MKRRVWLALSALILLALFVAARHLASHRPLLIGTHPAARTLALSHDGSRLFARGQAQVWVWDTATFAPPGQWQPPGFRLVPAPDGERVVVASSPISSSPTDALALTTLTGSVRDARSGAVICEFGDRWRHAKDVQDALQSLTWSADGREVVTLTNGALRRFDARDGRLIERVVYDARNGFTSWQLAPDADEIVAADRVGTHFYSAQTGQKLRFWKHPARATRSAPMQIAAIAPGGKWVALQQRNAPNNFTAFWVRASDGPLAWSKPQITTSVYSFEICNFSGDGETVLSLEGARICARRCADGREVWHLKAASVQNAALSPDGRFVYSVDVQGTIRRWNAPKT